MLKRHLSHGLMGLAMLAVTSTPAFSQQPAQASPNPLSTFLKTMYTNNFNNILRTAEKMPEENYGMRPGGQKEVRTFGQQVAHAAKFSFLWCSQAKGEKNPLAGKDPEQLTSKAEIIKVAQDSFTYCSDVYSNLTDASGAETIDVTQENGRQTKNLRMGLLILNYGHNAEIYGSMVSYLRMKDLVPPASEPRPAGKKQ